jgi:hypothetical protein
MWTPDPTRLDPAAAVSPTSFLLVQGVHELLAPTTPDSFAARTLDLALLLRDFLHVAEVSEDDTRWIHYWHPLAEELAVVADAEQRSIAPRSELRLALDDVIATARAGKDPKGLRQRILVALGHYGDPRTRLVEDLSELLRLQPNNKKAWLQRLSSIASHVEYQGLSSECAMLATEARLTEAPEVALDVILAPLLAKQQTFELALAIKGPGTDAQAITSRSMFSPALRNQTLKASPVTDQWLAEHTDDFVVSCSIESQSARSAAEIANGALAAILNLHNLYLNGSQYRVRPNLLYWTSVANPQRLTMAPSAYFGLMPRNDARSLTKQRIAKLQGRLEGRLANALECHALALSARDPQTAVINLWTALEAISGSPSSGAIGNHVAHTLAPNIAWRRVDKIVTYLAIQYTELCRRQGQRANGGVLRNSRNPNWVSPDDLLEAIAGPENNAKILHFLATTADHPLLRQRLYGAWKEFHDPAELRRTFEQSRQRVEWQLLRIYRARNLLVHRGEQNHLIWRLLKNAQYYVSISLSRVLHDMSSHRDWGVDASLQNQSLRYRHVLAGLTASRPTGLTHADLLGSRAEDGAASLWP